MILTWEYRSAAERSCPLHFVRQKRNALGINPRLGQPQYHTTGEDRALGLHEVEVPRVSRQDISLLIISVSDRVGRKDYVNEKCQCPYW